MKVTVDTKAQSRTRCTAEKKLTSTLKSLFRDVNIPTEPTASKGMETGLAEGEKGLGACEEKGKGDRVPKD